MSKDKLLQLHSTGYSSFHNKKSFQMLQRDDTLNLSAILNETSIHKTMNDTTLRQALDDTSIIVNKHIAGDGLCEIFFEIMLTSRQIDILDTLTRLASACCDALELVEPWNRYNVHNYWLAEEANTWKLLRCLYADSITDQRQAVDDVPAESTLSQQTLVSNLFRSDDELRLLQLLVDWLEATATYQVEATRTSAPIIGNNVQWGNTLHHMVVGSSLFNKEQSKTMVTCMDPDAPRRQRKAIHSEDQQDDYDFCKRIFTEVRCGNFNEAVDLCVKTGQAWRGAVLQGWRLLHYLPQTQPNSPVKIIGNPSRDIWKWCCLGIAKNTTENSHYRASVGILCGYLPSTLLVCQDSWEDLLWAHLRTQIEARVDKFLREDHSTAHANTTSPEILELLLSEYQIDELSLQQVFGAVNALMNGKRESNYQTCQRHLMLGHVRRIIQDALQWIQNAEEKFVRFLAHLVLILRQMGKDPHHDVGDKILETYVTQLILRLSNGSVTNPELIAYYVSTVPSDMQTTLFADLMDRVYKSEFRESVVKAGLTANIDIPAAARVAVKKGITNIQLNCGSIDPKISQTVGDIDKTIINRLISSLEWFSLIPNQLQDTLWLSNAMIRTFIFIGNTDAATSTLLTLDQTFPSLLNKVDRTSSELREYLCLKAYLEALDSFATWYRHYVSGQPKDAESLPEDPSFTDKVHHEQICAQVKQQKARWSAAVLHQSRYTKNLLYNVLLFPGGWLQDEIDLTHSKNFSEDEQDKRLKQLDTLRRLCIPEVVILILKILQIGDNVEDHKEALKLSDLIAAENRGLYKVFTKDKLMEILQRMKESSLLLLEKGKDIFGYDIND